MHTLLLKKTFNQRGESWGASDGESKSPVLNGFAHLRVLRSLPADVVSTLAASSEHSSGKQDRRPFREQAPWREVGARQGWVGAAPGRPEEAAVKGPGGGQVTPGVGGEARPLFWRKTLWAEAAGGREMAGPGVALGGAVDRACWRAGYTRGGVGAAPKWSPQRPVWCAPAVPTVHADAVCAQLCHPPAPATLGSSVYSFLFPPHLCSSSRLIHLRAVLPGMTPSTPHSSALSFPVTRVTRTRALGASPSCSRCPNVAKCSGCTYTANLVLLPQPSLPEVHPKPVHVLTFH